MTEETKDEPVEHTKPASKLLASMLAMLDAEFERRAAEVLRVAAEEAGVPAGSQYDGSRNLWVLPSEPAGE